MTSLNLNFNFHRAAALIVLVLTALCFCVPVAEAYPGGWNGGWNGGYHNYGGWNGGCYRGGWNGGWNGGCYRGGWNGGCGWGVPNGLGWTLFGLGVGAALTSVPVYAPPAPIVYSAPTYVYSAPQPVVGSYYTPPRQYNPPTQASSVLMRVQAKLSGLGYYRGGCDGEYGVLTQRAVEQFQADNSLPVSGRLDNRTLAALGVSG